MPSRVRLRLAPEKSAHAHRALVERQIGLTVRRGYEEACRMLARPATLEPPAEHAAYAAALRGA